MSYSFYYILWAGRSAEDRRLRKAEAAGSNPAQSILKISDDILEEYLNIIELSGITFRHKKEVKRTLKNYSNYILFRLDKAKSLMYFKKNQG